MQSRTLSGWLKIRCSAFPPLLARTALQISNSNQLIVHIDEASDTFNKDYAAGRGLLANGAGFGVFRRIVPAL